MIEVNRLAPHEKARLILKLAKSLHCDVAADGSGDVPGDILAAAGDNRINLCRIEDIVTLADDLGSDLDYAHEQSVEAQSVGAQYADAQYAIIEDVFGNRLGTAAYRRARASEDRAALAREMAA